MPRASSSTPSGCACVCAITLRSMRWVCTPRCAMRSIASLRAGWFVTTSLRWCSNTRPRDAAGVIEVLYTAAHGGFSAEAAPLGGGAAVCDHLMDEWSRTRPFPFRLIAPQDVRSKQIAQFGERDYARFSRQFERTSPEEILHHDPARTVVLPTAVSQAPHFA